MEAGPAGPTPSLPTDIAKWLATWPTPFRSFEEAKTFLGHEAWARGLQKRENGYHPRFDPAAMTEAVSELATENYWSDWSRITCPTLVLRGERGTMPAEEAKEMQTRRPDTKVEVITGAGHDVHLERLTQAYQAITAFLREDKYPPLWTRSGPRRGA